IESPSGDQWRETGKKMLNTTDDENPVFDVYNTGKKSISVNIKNEEGLAFVACQLDAGRCFLRLGLESVRGSDSLHAVRQEKFHVIGAFQQGTVMHLGLFQELGQVVFSKEFSLCGEFAAGKCVLQDFAAVFSADFCFQEVCTLRQGAFRGDREGEIAQFACIHGALHRGAFRNHVAAGVHNAGTHRDFTRGDAGKFRLEFQLGSARRKSAVGEVHGVILGGGGDFGKAAAYRQGNAQGIAAAGRNVHGRENLFQSVDVVHPAVVVAGGNRTAIIPDGAVVAPGTGTPAAEGRGGDAQLLVADAGVAPQAGLALMGSGNTAQIVGAHGMAAAEPGEDGLGCFGGIGDFPEHGYLAFAGKQRVGLPQNHPVVKGDGIGQAFLALLLQFPGTGGKLLLVGEGIVVIFKVAQTIRLLVGLGPVVFQSVVEVPLTELVKEFNNTQILLFQGDTQIFVLQRLDCRLQHSSQQNCQQKRQLFRISKASRKHTLLLDCHRWAARKCNHIFIRAAPMSFLFGVQFSLEGLEGFLEELGAVGLAVGEDQDEAGTGFVILGVVGQLEVGMGDVHT
ncbi:MAG: CoA transferase, partial [Victivallales bacterium]|nr:CoA transferase [Victivallales bacterium]